MNSKLQNRMSGYGQGKQIRCRFDLDTGLYVTRLLLCSGLGLCSLFAIIFAGLPILAAIPLLLSIPLVGAVAWFSYRQLQLRQPVIAVGRRGIWDRRLGIGVIPWTEVVRVRTDGRGNVILDPWEAFSGLKENTLTRLDIFLGRLDPSLKPGSVKIRLHDVQGESWDLLAAIEASLPYYLRSLWHPEATRRRIRPHLRYALVSLGAVTASVFLFVSTASHRGDAGAVMHNLGPAKDVGAVPGKYESPTLDAYRQAAERGDTDARMRLGLMFHEGEGVPRDQGQAAHWFRLAASDDLPAGQAALGYLHEKGLGVAQDFGKALTWYRRAAEKKHSWALYRLGLMYRDGRGVPRNATHAVDLLAAAAEQGDVAGRFHLGEMYENGWGVHQDAARASEWYRLAAQQNHERAEYNLAALYRDGRGVPRDPVRAALWFERSAAKGYSPSQYALGLAFEVGRGVHQDYRRAVLWYYLAQLHGHSEAANRHKQLMKTLTPAQRKEINAFRINWLRKSLLRDEAAAKFADYHRRTGPKAFAVAMNGAWAQTDNAKHARDAIYHAMKRCRQYASVCMLYAVGDTVVAGRRDAEVDSIVAKALKKPSAH